MQHAAHPALQRLVDHLVLLDTALAAEALRHNLCRVVVAVACEVADGDRRTWDALADEPSDLVRWRIAAPGDAREIEVPDLRILAAGLPSGALDIVVAAGRLRDFEWGKLELRDLRTQNMDAYAVDSFDARY